ncbi:MAG: hypothetical protein KIT09_05720 [Bryobacteraceae bacterium]|nr:hypothetical protein [Bryobacteraceae bacterium]
MKIYAHYDSDGNIRSMVTVEGPEGAGVMLTPDTGLSVAEIEGLTLKGGMEDVEELRNIAANYKVKAPAQRATLEKKGKAG